MTAVRSSSTRDEADSIELAVSKTLARPGKTDKKKIGTRRLEYLSVIGAHRSNLKDALELARSGIYTVDAYYIYILTEPRRVLGFLLGEVQL